MRYCRFLLAVALLAAPAADVAAQAPLRVMSFNIRYGTASDGDHVWPNRRAHVVATLRDHAPHLLGVQEALRFQLDEIGTALPHYRRLGVGRDDGQSAGEHAAILVDTSRLSVVDQGTFWLSDTPDVPGSMHWGNRITRICTWVRVADRATGDTVQLYNVHLDHESQPSRERAVRLVLARMRSTSGADRMLLLGDFNADESNAAFRAVITDRTVGLRDTYRARYPNADVVGTFNAFRGDSTAGKIDAVLAGPGWTTLDAGIDRRRFGARWASDHFAVWAVLRAQRPGD